MTVVSGVSRPGLIGARGTVLIGGSSFAAELGFEVSLGGDRGGFEGTCESFRTLLFCRSATSMLPNVFPLPVETIEALSGLTGGLSALFLDLDLKTSLIRAPGETPRPSLVDSASFVSIEMLGGTCPIVAACCGPRLDGKAGSSEGMEKVAALLY